MADQIWFLKNCDLFKRLSPEEIQRIESKSKFRKFERKSLIYLPADQNDAVLLLVSGRVKLYHITGEGKQTLLAIIDPGEIFGELALFNSGKKEEFAETMQPSSVIMIPGSEIQRLMEEHSTVSLGVTRLMGLRRWRIERRLKSLLFRSTRDRLVYLLLELAEKYGRRTTEGVLIATKISHQEMSSMIGSTRETVTNQLGELQLEGNLRVRRRQLILPDIARLATTIDESPPKLSAESSPGQPELRRAAIEP